MRLRLLLVLAIVLLVPVVVSAEGFRDRASEVPDELKLNPPPGTYWSEELGVFVFDPPIPIAGQSSVLNSNGDDVLLFDQGDLWYWVYFQTDYYPATRFPVPDCGDRVWLLTAVKIGFYNLELIGSEVPDPAVVTVVAHNHGCLNNPLGVGLGTELRRITFTPEDFNKLIGCQGGVAKFQDVTLNVPVAFGAGDFWVCFEHIPQVPSAPLSHYALGSPAELPPGEEYNRSYFKVDGPCPLLVDLGYGVWLIRAVGHCADIPSGKIDIKPMSCPNPINPGDIGLVSVAIVGTEAFDVRDIVPSSAALNSVGPVRWEYEDVATPFEGELCGCHELGGDGFEDLVFKFVTQDVFLTLDDPEDNEEVRVTMTWETQSEIPMQGQDCFLVRLKNNEEPEEVGGGLDSYTGGEGIKGEESGPQLSVVNTIADNAFALYPNTPNPFRDRTTLRFSLGQMSHVTLTVHDATGREVASLVDGELPGGIHTVDWHTRLPSGMYFCRLQAEGLTAAHRMVVVR